MQYLHTGSCGGVIPPLSLLTLYRTLNQLQDTTHGNHSNSNTSNTSLLGNDT